MYWKAVFAVVSSNGAPLPASHLLTVCLFFSTDGAYARLTGVILYILLSGTHPFHTNTLFDQITHASYSMQGEEWETITNAAKDLVRRLLTESPKDRLTAEQALSHPFITKRPSAKNTSAALGGTEGSALKSTEGKTSGTKSVEVSCDPSEGGNDVTEIEGASEEEWSVGGGGQNSSEDTELSSASGVDDSLSGVSLKSLSPSDGGGRAARGAPAGVGTGSGSRDTRPTTPREDKPHLPPPHPREPGKGRESGVRAVGRGRKRQKKEGAASEKPLPAYSQLQMRVCAGGSDQVNGEDSSDGINVMSAPARQSASGSNGRAGNEQWKAALRQRGEVQANGWGTPPSQWRGKPSSPLASPIDHPAGRDKRKSVDVAHALQCAKVMKVGGEVGTRRPAPRPAAPELPGDDDIVDYSSEESPVKGRRDRFGRARLLESSAKGHQAVPRSSTAAAAKPASGAGSQQLEGNGSHQMHLKVSDSGKLDLSKLGPLPRSSGTGERTSGDRATQAAAGGAAASLEDSVGGGAPAGSGGSSSDATSDSKGGKGTRKPKESSKPQRTMTNLWGRAGWA